MSICAPKPHASCRSEHINDAQIEAINELASIANRLRGSYEVYGGVDIKKALTVLEPIIGDLWRCND